ncbi:hypothetical protein M9435_003179 [Picochlorum sp. BPE23]|nr:hypothetical protein M9435_003179 [Picochlorum sp. BPE23]
MNDNRVDQDQTREWDRASGAKLVFLQFRTLVRKEWLVRKRKTKLNFLLLVSSTLCVGMIWVFNAAMDLYQQMDSNRRVVKYSEMISMTSAIPSCKDNIFMRQDIPCFSLLYAPENKETREIVNNIREDNVPSIDASLVKGFSSGKEMDEYLYTHPNSVVSAVEFFKESDKNYAFSVQTNGTVRWFKGVFQQPHLYAQLPVVVAVQKALASMIAGTPKEWTVRIGEYPHPAVSAQMFTSKFAPLFFVSSILLVLILQIYEIVEQKERGTIGLLTLTGLQFTPYWSYLVATYSTLHLANASLLSLLSVAIQFQPFHGVKILYCFLLLANSSQAIMALGLLSSSLLRKTSSAISTGFLLFSLAWIMMVFLSFGFPFSLEGEGVWKTLFCMFPWTITFRGYELLSDSNTASETSNFSILMALLSAQNMIYTVLAIYFDACLPDINGKRRIPWFLFRLKQLHSKGYVSKSLLSATNQSNRCSDDAIDLEERKIKELCRKYITESIEDPEYAIQIQGLRKEYNLPGWLNRSSRIALDGDWFGVKAGECFCLLGPNSAGKTTLIKCLLGLTKASSGQAIIDGKSTYTSSDLQEASKNIGYCPQHDGSLCDLLTVWENYELFCAAKGVVPSLAEKQNVPIITGQPNATLLNASPSERRQLSIAIALIGNPKVIVLDEPTANVDPFVKRTLWKHIEELKNERSTVFLSTHSMHEAEILSDRIGIMVRGKLRCLGSPLELKRRFGSGYKISLGLRKDVAVDQKTIQENIVQLMRKSMTLKSVEFSADYVNITLPYEMEDRLPLMLTQLNNNMELLHIRDVQLRPTPMEEVFMTITKKAELENAEAEGRFETLILAEEGIALKIPVGADYIESPGGNFYTIKWTKDRLGHLRIHDYSPDKFRIREEKDR